MTTADDLLRRALESLNDREAQLKELGWGCLAARALEEDIRAYLDAPKDKPIVYIKDRELVYIEGLKQAGLATEWHTNLGFVKEDGDVGLYTHPPTKTAPKKPMTEEQLDNIVCLERVNLEIESIYKMGFRDAEKHHGIGGGE